MIDLHLSAFAPRWRFLYVVRIDAYISPFLKKLYCRSSYLLYNQNKHCGFVNIKLQHESDEQNRQKEQLANRQMGIKRAWGVSRAQKP